LIEKRKVIKIQKMQKKEENRARQKHISLHNVLSKNTYESIYT